MQAAVGEEKRRIEEQRELMERSAEEIQEGFKKRETVLEARHQLPFIADVLFFDFVRDLREFAFDCRSCRMTLKIVHTMGRISEVVSLKKAANTTKVVAWEYMF